MRIFFIFVFVSLGSALAINFLGIPFGFDSFWQHHGLWFLVLVAFFPRLTLIFATPWGGLFWWLGLVFFPRILVACLATLYYWNENPILVICAWLMALGGESAEKYAVRRRVQKL